MRTRWLFCLLFPVIWGCESNPASQANEDLSRVLAISQLSKVSVPGDGGIVGVVINVVVINTGPIVIDVPFVMRWALRNAQGHELASGQKAMPANMAPGAQRQVSLTLTFPAVPSLGGYQDVVTFDLVE